MQIRPALIDDCPAIAAIYAHHVRHGTASYETSPPDSAEMTRRMERVLGAGWPWLVAAAADGSLMGYAYATQFRDRAAYRFVCEDSIYVRHDVRGQGVGKALLTALVAACTVCGPRGAGWGGGRQAGDGAGALRRVAREWVRISQDDPYPPAEGRS